MRNEDFEQILSEASEESRTRVREFMERLEEGATTQRINVLEQRIQRQAELLEQMERALNELTEMLRPSPDPTDQIQKLHKQIIDQYPVEPGQLYQAIDSDGTACRYSEEPYLGIAQGVWNYNGPLWTLDDVELNGINWKDTLIKL